VNGEIELTVIDDGERSTITVERGTTLRDALRDRGFSVYRWSRASASGSSPEGEARRRIHQTT
jgi:hypothetical protein